MAWLRLGNIKEYTDEKDNDCTWELECKGKGKAANIVVDGPNIWFLCKRCAKKWGVHRTKENPDDYNT